MIRTIIQMFGKSPDIRLLVTLKQAGRRTVRILMTRLASKDVEQALDDAVAQGRARIEA